METTEAGSSTDPQKKYAINILAWDVAILCYFSEAAATMVNQSGKDIWCTGAAILIKLTVFLSKNLVIHSLTLQQTTPLNLNINGLKYSSPMENKLDFPSFQEKKNLFYFQEQTFFKIIDISELQSTQSIFKNPTNMKVHGLVTSFSTGLIGYPGTFGMLKCQ